ncbi:Hypothetical predicted protein [Olea europaea subsp. europaea]|uniref:SHSP domain-containing protein n=1 Tax=Olea europaea subsp. europaea TaxID=158383 RepID=A0A8S0V1G1_OLEEU|nr:Hypothetical predicted protein [Olea europaea subsp. europaea]
MATRPVGTGGATPHHSRFHYRSEYEIFQPMSEWQQDEESDILILYLPGFMKEQLKAETDRNIVRVRGERLVAGGILTITLPRKTGGTIGDKDKKRDFQQPILQSKTRSDSKPQQEHDNSPDKKSLETLTPQKSRFKEENDRKKNDEAKARTAISEKSLEKIVEQERRSTEKSELPTDAEIVTKMIVEKENTKKDKAIEDKESKGKQRTNPSIIDSAILTLEKYKKAVKGFAECKEKRRLLVNMGATVLVIMALGVLVSYAIKSGKTEH